MCVLLLGLLILLLLFYYYSIRVIGIGTWGRFPCGKDYSFIHSLLRHKAAKNIKKQQVHKPKTSTSIYTLHTHNMQKLIRNQN